MELTHTRLLVENYTECFLFYRDVLGFEVGWGDETSLYADFRVTDTYNLAIFDRKQMVQALGNTYTPLQDTPETVSLIFRVESVDQQYRETKDRIDFLTTPTERPDWGIKVAHFRDPAGNLIEINERLG